jgi:octaprenyl-diphosphate synthase
MITMDVFYETIKNDVDKKIRDCVNSENNKKLEYLSEGGKRWRSFLCILAFKACGGTKEGYQKALDLAVALELLHSASLVHDDIIDWDLKRRGKLSYFKAFGISDAILMGHKAIVIGLKNLLGHDQKILETCLDVWEMSLEGEFKEIDKREEILNHPGVINNLYFEVIQNKTASLFAGAAKIGSQEAKANGELQEVLWEYGRCLGIAFQLEDDFQDINNESTESILVAWVLSQLDDITKKSLMQSMKKNSKVGDVFSRFKINLEDIFNREIDKMKQKAKDLAKNKIIPESEYKILLAEVPDALIKIRKK